MPMAQIIAFVSVNKSITHDMTLHDVGIAARGNWPISLSKAKSCDTLVAVKAGVPVASWEVVDAYATEETYKTNGGERPRVAFVLGRPLPVLPEYLTEFTAPQNLRRGIATEAWEWTGQAAGTTVDDE